MSIGSFSARQREYMYVVCVLCPVLHGKELKELGYRFSIEKKNLQLHAGNAIDSPILNCPVSTCKRKCEVKDNIKYR